MKENEKRVPINARLTVLNVSQLSDNLIRICFKSDKPLTINPLWIGPHLKLLFADPKTGEIVFPQSDENNKIIWQEGVRERVRTYSIRDYDAKSSQLTIDFVIHKAGVATVWAQQAKVGEQVGLVGMGAKKQFDDNELVLVGDISAMPTICYTLENLPEGRHVTAFIEVNKATDVIEFKNTNQADVNWIIREKGQASQLLEKVLQHSFTSSDKLLFWGGMESSLAQQLRHALKDKYPDLSTDAIQIISYWREGFAEGEFRHRD